MMLECNWDFGWYGDFDSAEDDWNVCELVGVRFVKADRGEPIEFGGSFRERSKIKEVKIYQSEVEYIPRELQLYFPSMKYLFVNTCNNLESINNSFIEGRFERLESLTILRISGEDEELKYIKGSPFEKLPKLTKLMLSEKMIETLSENSFKGLTLLKELNLFTNNIESLPVNLFKDLRRLETISLASNMIEELGDDLFMDNSRLKVIELFTNKIETLSEKLLRNLWNLEELDLNFNRLKHLSANTFKNNKKLTTLSLRGNKIVRIEPDTFRGLQNLESLDFSSNMCVSEYLVDLEDHKIDVKLKQCHENWKNNIKYKWRPAKTPLREEN